MANRLEYAFEGTDAGGKSTQSRMLKEYYEQLGINVELRTSPSRSLVGKIIRNNLEELNQAGLKGAALFKLDIARSYRGIPDSTQILIWDRHIYSIYAANRVHDLATIRGLKPHVPEPPKVFYMDVSPELSLERGLAITDHPLTLEQLREKQERYNELLREDPQRFLKIDASLPLCVVFEQLVAIINRDLTSSSVRTHSLTPITSCNVPYQALA